MTDVCGDRDDVATIEQLEAESEMRRRDHLDACKKIDQLTAERDALRVASKACRERNEVLCAERDALKAVRSQLERALETQRADNERLRAEVASITDRSLNRANTIGSLNKRLTELREAALALACEHMGMGGNEELLLWLETLPATDPGHDTPWGRFFAVLAKLKP